MSSTVSANAAQRAEQLNHDCHCPMLDRDSLQRRLLQLADGAQLWAMLSEQRPHLLADTAVYLSAPAIKAQADIIQAIERVIALPAYQARVLAYAPASAHYLPAASGVFLGYDFHLSPDGPKLIEINSNAGGAMITLLQAQNLLTHHACPSHPQTLINPQPSEQAILTLFLNEWQRSQPDRALHSIAIIDESPEQQYLWPEFLLFQDLFQRHGIQTLICDPTALQYRQGKLWHQATPIDLVYNRLTDFALEHPTQHALLQAYLDQAVVVTPHPRNHALYADKRNLILLTDPAALQAIGVDSVTQDLLLQGIAKTRHVRDFDPEQLWQQRKQWFFKPAKGYGSKAAYRGDKLTRRVFAEILQADYVAQILIPPSLRQRQLADQSLIELKLDLRNYVYQGQVQSICARLYQGQTTNFRTPGGGFAPVIAIRDAADST